MDFHIEDHLQVQENYLEAMVEDMVEAKEDDSLILVHSKVPILLVNLFPLALILDRSSATTASRRA